MILALEEQGEEFRVHLTRDELHYTGTVYPVHTVLDLTTGIQEVVYPTRSSDGESGTAPTSDCQIAFSFSFCWRGVWEGRLYFVAVEYWSEDLPILAKVWEQLERHLRTDLRQNYPERQFTD